jgi:predicted RNA-binding protein
MCLASAYFDNENGQVILKDIAHLKFNGDMVELETLFGEGKSVQGRVIEVDFFSSKIILEAAQAEAAVENQSAQLEK